MRLARGAAATARGGMRMLRRQIRDVQERRADMILIVRDDGVIRVDGAWPVAPSFLETVEQLFRKLDVRPRPDERQHDSEAGNEDD